MYVRVGVVGVMLKHFAYESESESVSNANLFLQNITKVKDTNHSTYAETLRYLGASIASRMEKGHFWGIEFT